MMKKLNKVDRPLLTEVPVQKLLLSKELKDAMAKGIKLIDTRDKVDFAEGFIPVSYNIPIYNFNNSVKEDFSLMYKLIKAFESKFPLLQITSAKTKPDKESIEANRNNFAALNNRSYYDYHVINDTDVENGVIHFNQQINMDIICIGTHGNFGNSFHY